jgi:hypothetical protein
VTNEETRLWLGGMSRRQVAENIGRLTRPWPMPRHGGFSKVRPGRFICDRHWQQITDSWRRADPILPMSVTNGLMTACFLWDENPRRNRPDYTPEPVTHACCRLNASGWDGLIRLCRRSAVESLPESAPRSA